MHANILLSQKFTNYNENEFAPAESIEKIGNLFTSELELGFIK